MNDGGPAFPIAGGSSTSAQGSYWSIPQPGMSLRDYFAAKALLALASATNMEGYLVCGSPENAAKDAYKFADAMILAREQLPQLHDRSDK